MNPEMRTPYRAHVQPGLTMLWLTLFYFIVKSNIHAAEVTEHECPLFSPRAPTQDTMPVFLRVLHHGHLASKCCLLWFVAQCTLKPHAMMAGALGSDLLRG